MSTHPPGTFCWYELATSNQAKAKDFYTSLFGWTAEDHPMPGGQECVYTMFKLDGKDVGGAFELTGPMAGIPPHWGTYLASDDIDASAAAIKAKGGELIYEPMDVPTVGRMCAFKGPGGESLSVYKGAEEKGAYFPAPTVGAFCWTELMTRNADEAKDFYTQVFSWGTEVKDMGHGPYTVFKTGETMLGGMMTMPPEVPAEVPPHWMPYIMVADCAGTTAKARDLGATVIIDSMAIPSIGTFSLFVDPTGANLSIITFES